MNATHYSIDQNGKISEGKSSPNHIEWDRVLLAAGDSFETVRTTYDLDPLSTSVWTNTETFRSAMIDFEDRLFIDFVTVSPTADSFDRAELALVVSGDKIISIEAEESRVLDQTIANGQIARRKIETVSTALVAYQFTRVLFDAIDKKVNSLEDKLDQIEDIIVQNRKKNTTLDLFDLFDNVAILRKITSSWPRLIDEFEETNLFEHHSVLVSDLGNRSFRLNASAETLHERMRNIQEQQIVFQNARLSRTMQLLTVVSTIFIPLSFLSGVYGTNFVHVPELEWQYSYPVFWMVLLLIAGLILYFFRRDKWI